MHVKKLLAIVLVLTLAISSVIPTWAITETNYQGVIAQIDELDIENTASSTKTAIDSAWTAYNALPEADKLNVTNVSKLQEAYETYYNAVANENGGKLTYMDFEDGTADDTAGRVTATIGSSVSVANEGKYGTKSISTVNTNSLNSMVSWESDNYDPFLYTKDSGTSISMWINPSAIQNQNYFFNYGFWGYRLYIGYDNDKFKVSTRNNDSDPTSELIVPNSSELLNKWTLLTVTCDADRKWSVYFNDELKASGTLVYKPYDMAERRATKQRRGEANWISKYCLGAAHYWSGNNNTTAKYDDFAIYNSALNAEQIKMLYDNNLVQDTIDLIDALPTTITLQDDAAISAAKSAYDLLNAQEKEEVTNYNKVVTAEAKYVEAMINALGPITADKADQVIAARAAFEKLSTEQKAMVTNINTLTEAEEAIAQFGDIADVISKINAIGTVTYKSKSLIAAARAAFNALLAEDQEAIPTYFTKLTAAETELEEIYDAYTVSVTGWASASTSPWTEGATEDEKTKTRDAFTEEMKYQYVERSYNLGRTTGTYGLDNWMNILDIQITDMPNDNAGNPWGDSRNWAWITSPFAEIAFSEAGYFAKSVSYTKALSNSFVYDGKIYQQFWNEYRYHDYKESVNGGSAALTNVSVFPGKGNNGDVTNDTFRYAYANYNQTNKWAGYNVGLADENAIQKAAYTYQKFTGPQGKAYIVASADDIASATKDASKVEGAYVIARDMATKFMELGADDDSRFAFTGLPVSNEYDDGKGNLRQDFDEISIIINKTSGEVTFLNTAAKVLDITAPEIAKTIINNEVIYVLINSGSTFDTSSITVSLKTGSTYEINAVTGKPNQYDVVVTAESGDTITHTLYIINEDDVSESDKKAIENSETQLMSLPAFIYRNDLDAAKEVLSDYDDLTFVQQLIVKNEDRISELRARVEEIQASPIRVTCIGSSTSYGSGATNEAADSYPAQMERMFGGTISVTNPSVPGTTVVTKAPADGVGTYAYMETSEYPRGLASKPDVVFMFVGSNDAEGGRWTSNGYKDEFIKDYTTIIKAYQALESKPYVILCYPYESYAGDRATYIPQIIDVIDNLAAEYSCGVLDMYTPTKALLDDTDWRTYFGDDKLHPTTAGYTKIAEVAKEYLSNFIDDQIDNFDVEDIKLDGTSMADFDAEKDTYTVSYSGTLPVISADMGGDYSVNIVQPTAENTIGYVCVESKLGKFGKYYQINFEEDTELPMLGDLNGDGKLTVTDIVSLRSLIMDNTEISQEMFTIADTNKDNSITVTDIVKLRSMIMGEN